MPTDLKRYRQQDGVAKDYKPTARASAIALFEIGLAIRRPWVIVLIVLAWLNAITRSVYFLIITQGHVNPEFVLAQGLRQFTNELMVLLEYQTHVAVVLLAVVGAVMVARDVGSGAHNFFFSRDITPLHYIAGKASALVFFMFIVLWLPPMLFFAFVILSSGETNSTSWMVVSPDITIPRVLQLLAFLTFTTVVLISLCLTISAATSSPRYGTLVFVTCWFGGWYLKSMLGHLPGLKIVQYLSLPYDLERIGRVLFALDSPSPETWGLVGCGVACMTLMVVIVRQRLFSVMGMR
jgi:ABC-type transport system involved in multi-copper enzyme maturation permease subunit